MNAILGLALMVLVMFSPQSLAEEAPQPLEQKRKAFVLKIMNELDAGPRDLSMIPEVYEDEAFFSDPIVGPKGIRGHELIRRYHRMLHLISSRFDVDVLQYFIGDDAHMVHWKAYVDMDFGLGRPGSEIGIRNIVYEGASKFEFLPGEAKIMRHLDLYTESEFYEQVPVMGPMLKKFKDATRKAMVLPIPEQASDLDFDRG